MRKIETEIRYFAADSGNIELSTEFMPVTKGLLEKYKDEDIINAREGQMPGGKKVRIAEIHVTKVDAAYIEAETNQENPVFFYGVINTFIMAVTNTFTTGSNIVVKQDKTIN